MKSLILGLILVINVTAVAGPRVVGNGGVGIVIDGTVYMLDLYERSIHRNAYYNDTITVRHWVEDRLSDVFRMSDLTDVPLQKASKKISEVLSANYFVGAMLVKIIEELDWRLIDSELVTTDDVHSAIDGNLVQIAVRQQNVVFINKILWNQLDDDNKLALIIHEAFYFWYEAGDGKASVTRHLTGLLFTQRFALEGFTKKNLLNYSSVFDLFTKQVKDLWKSTDRWLSYVYFASEYFVSAAHYARRGTLYNKMNYDKTGAGLDEMVHKTCEGYFKKNMNNTKKRQTPIKIAILGDDIILKYYTESNKMQLHSSFDRESSGVHEFVLVGKNMNTCKYELAKAYEKLFSKFIGLYSFENK